MQLEEFISKHNVDWVYEDSAFYYISVLDNKNSSNDNSFYLYNKRDKSLKWVFSVFSFLDKIAKAKEIHIR